MNRDSVSGVTRNGGLAKKSRPAKGRPSQKGRTARQLANRGPARTPSGSCLDDFQSDETPHLNSVAASDTLETLGLDDAPDHLDTRDLDMVDWSRFHRTRD